MKSLYTLVGAAVVVTAAAAISYAIGYMTCAEEILDRAKKFPDDKKDYTLEEVETIIFGECQL
jgi:hypothetical protein